MQRAAPRGGPFDFERQPFRLSASLELPTRLLACAAESIPARADSRLSPLEKPRHKSIIRAMKAHVYVTLKRTVLDAQGQTVAGALRRMGLNGVADVRQGKYFLLTLEDSLASSPAAAQLEVERIAREVLTNPVIEEFSLRLEP